MVHITLLLGIPFWPQTTVYDNALEYMAGVSGFMGRLLDVLCATAIRKQFLCASRY
jgi:hypothetical protein